MVTVSPRAMKRATAAAYCDLSIAAFEGEVLAGRLPAPFTLGGREHWDVKAIDKALDRIAGEREEDVPEYVRNMRDKYGPQAA